MAREYAPVRLSIWADDDFRALSPRAQHLYFVLLTSPSLSFCGVADWRPKRIGALSAGWSASAVEQAAEELSSRRYIVVDEDTEEVLIRSFVRHDGLMRQPNMAVAMATAHMSVASGRIRAVVAEEVKRLSIDQPELACWGAKASKDILAQMIESVGKGSSGPDLTSVKGSVKGSVNPSVKGSDPEREGFRQASSNGSVKGSVTPAPSPAPQTLTRGGALFDAPHGEDDKPETEGQLVNRLARIYTDQIKLTKFTAVSGVVRAAVQAKTDGVRDYSDTQITEAMRRLVEERRTVTKDSLRIAIEGLPLPTQHRRVNGSHEMSEAQLRMHALNPHLAGKVAQ